MLVMFSPLVQLIALEIINLPLENRNKKTLEFRIQGFSLMEFSFYPLARMMLVRIAVILSEICFNTSSEIVIACIFFLFGADSV